MPDTKRGREEKGKNKRAHRRRVLVDRELRAPTAEPDDLEAFEDGMDLELSVESPGEDAGDEPAAEPD